MNKKLAEKLKQAYSHLGLAENVLQMHADALVGTGLVTEENLDDVVAKQKDFLEGLQKYNDTRVNDAVKKAGEKALKEAEEKAQKAAEDAAAKAKEEALKALPDSVKAYVDSVKADAEAKEARRLAEAEEARKAAEAAQKEKDDAVAKKLDDLLNTLNGLKSENDALKKAQAVKERQDKILNKAKELGIPQYRIDEGFVIADDATDEQISTYLSTIAKNIKTSQLPGQTGHQVLPEGEASKEEVDKIAASMVNNL